MFTKQDAGKPASKSGASAVNAAKLASGNLSPEDAARGKHDPHAVLGESDSTYHNSGPAC